MPLTYLLDEHLRGPLWRAIQRHNALGTDPLDAVRVGDVEDLLWAASIRTFSSGPREQDE